MTAREDLRGISSAYACKVVWPAARCVDLGGMRCRYVGRAFRPCTGGRVNFVKRAKAAVCTTQSDESDACAFACLEGRQVDANAIFRRDGY